jgi:diadenylate cyclase
VAGRGDDKSEEIWLRWLIAVRPQEPEEKKLMTVLIEVPLNLPHVRVLQSCIERCDLTVTVESTLESASCPHCGEQTSEFHPNGETIRLPSPSFREVSFLGKGQARTRSDSGTFKSISQRLGKCDKKNLEPTIELALEIAREGREGRRIGTLFTFGDADAVLERSRPLILDPLAGHTHQAKTITDPNLRGTIKELAQLDGAFVVSDEGIVLSACRYLDAMACGVALPYGMASRHFAGASISKVTDAVAIVVSESSMVRVFDDGSLIAEIIAEIIPELER